MKNNPGHKILGRNHGRLLLRGNRGVLEVVIRCDRLEKFFPGDLIKFQNQWGYVLGFRKYSETIVWQKAVGYWDLIRPHEINNVENYSRMWRPK